MMNRGLAIFIGHLCLACAFGSPAEKPTTASVALELSGRGTNGELQAGGYAGASVEGALRRHFGDVFLASLRLSVDTEAGSSRDPYADENRPGTRLSLKEVSLQAEPLRGLVFRGGALASDGLHDSELLFRTQTFPGLSEKGELTAGDFTFAASAEQLLPGTLPGLGELTPRAGNIPLFFRERATVRYQLRDAVRAEVDAGHFLFRDLDANVAHRSRFYGSTVTGAGAALADFTYAFHGLEAGVSLAFDAGLPVSLRLEAAALRNAGAPGGRNLAHTLGIAFPSRLSRTVLVTPRAELFAREPDATPAVFVARDWGRANRRGFALGADAELGDGFSAGFRFVSGTAISPNPYQSDARYFVFTLRSLHEIL